MDGLGNWTSRFRDSEGILLPLLGVPSVTTVFCDEGYGTVVYQSDRYGFRNPDYVWEWRPGLSAAAIGDSYTHGACVHEGESYVDQLRKDWARFIKLGMVGNGPLMGLASLKEYLAQIRPDFVFWFFLKQTIIPTLIRNGGSHF